MAQDPNVPVWRRPFPSTEFVGTAPLNSADGMLAWNPTHSKNSLSPSKLPSLTCSIGIALIWLRERTLNQNTQKVLSLSPVNLKYCASETNLPWRFRKKGTTPKCPLTPCFVVSKQIYMVVIGQGTKYSSATWLGLTPSAKRLTSLDINRLLWGHWFLVL